MSLFGKGKEEEEYHRGLHDAFVFCRRLNQSEPELLEQFLDEVIEKIDKYSVPSWLDRMWVRLHKEREREQEKEKSLLQKALSPVKKVLDTHKKTREEVEAK